MTKNYFISGNPVSLDHRKCKESVFSKDFFELKTQPKCYDSSLQQGPRDLWLFRIKSVSENMPPIYCSLAPWKSCKVCPFSYLKGKILAALYTFALPQDLPLSCLTWAPSVPRKFSLLNITWNFGLHVGIICFSWDCSLPSGVLFCSMFSLFSTTFFFGFAHPYYLENVFKHTPQVHSTSPAWSITITAIPWVLLPSQFYIQLRILLSIPYLLTL